MYGECYACGKDFDVYEAENRFVCSKCQPCLFHLRRLQTGEIRKDIRLFCESDCHNGFTDGLPEKACWLCNLIKYFEDDDFGYWAKEDACA